jgi:hypothetical protein
MIMTTWLKIISEFSLFGKINLTIFELDKSFTSNNIMTETTQSAQSAQLTRYLSVDKSSLPTYHDLEGVRILEFSKYGDFTRVDFKQINLREVDRLDILGPAYRLSDLDLKQVTRLHLGENFDGPVEGLDLKQVKQLELGGFFNRPVEQLDLKEVIRLYLGGEFDQPVERLDLKRVQELRFGDQFDQHVDHLDLKEVKRLHFGRKFNRMLTQFDLKGVKHLTFGSKYKHSIRHLDLSQVFELTLEFADDQKSSYISQLDHDYLEMIGFVYVGSGQPGNGYRTGTCCDKYLALKGEPRFPQNPLLSANPSDWPRGTGANSLQGEF